MLLDWTGETQPNAHVLLDGVPVAAIRADDAEGWVEVDAAWEDFEHKGIVPKEPRTERRTGKVEFQFFLPKVFTNLKVSPAGRMTLNP